MSFKLCAMLSCVIKSHVFYSVPLGHESYLRLANLLHLSYQISCQREREREREITFT